MAIEIKINHALKKYEGLTVIPDLNLEVKPGEFFTLLGPSGCGKTTLLRMIAGFNSVEGGEFLFNDKVINNIEPAKRNIGMVFQNYAIFPHLTVRENVAFGLKNRKLPKEEIKQITDKFLDLMQISCFQDRMPDRLSGGQQQRVALARALAISPDVLLMDEPLSNLDAKLRLEMRKVIKDIQRKVGITTVYVTHDQEEAMAVSDRIAVMNGGVIQQIGSPRNLYQRPANVFVATFIGHTNILKAKASGKTVVFCNDYKVEIDGMKEIDGCVSVSIRPEEFVINSNLDVYGLEGTIEDCTYLGLDTQYFIRLEDDTLVEIIRESIIGKDLEIGDKVKLSVKKEKINVFDCTEAANSLMCQIH